MNVFVTHQFCFLLLIVGAACQMAGEPSTDASHNTLLEKAARRYSFIDLEHRSKRSLKGSKGGPVPPSPPALPESRGNRCQKQFTCKSCLTVPGCGWCDGYRYKLCQLEGQKKAYCNGGQDDWIGQVPAGQQCPSMLFQGSSIGPKHEETGAKRREVYPKRPNMTSYNDLPWKSVSLSVGASEEDFKRKVNEAAEYLEDGLEVAFKIILAFGSQTDPGLRLQDASNRGNALASRFIRMLMGLANGTTIDQAVSCTSGNCFKQCRNWF